MNGRSVPRPRRPRVAAPRLAPRRSHGYRGAPSNLHVNAAELLREPGTQRPVTAVVDPADIGAEHDAVAGDVTVDVELESTLDDIGLTGTITLPWRGTCPRCLQPVAATVVVDVEERYAEHPAEHDDAFPIEQGRIDLAAMVREHVLLAAAEDRLCRPDCAGLCPVCGADRNTDPCDCLSGAVDERWAVLDQLRES